MLRERQSIIFGSGDKTRDYIHVSNMVVANLLAIRYVSKTIFNISTNVETSDREIFGGLARLLSYSGSPAFTPVRTSEIYSIRFNATRHTEN